VTASRVEIAPDLHLTTETTGAGAPVVFVGGLGDDRHLFDALVWRLAPGLECTTFDNRGVGAGATSAAGSTLADWADDAHRLVAGLGRGPVAAVGCSMGSGIVQEWALRHPDDLRAIVLISTWSRRDAYMQALLAHWRELARGRELERLGESVALLCSRPGWFEPAPEGEAEALPPLETLLAQLDACLAHEAEARLGALDLPALVIAGSHDQIVGPHLGAATAAAIPGAGFELLETGHVPFWERPEECAALVSSFLNRELAGR
jgi:pimeloyl-ACP methyl ester carboxylesterase